MDLDEVVRARGVSKLYRIGAREASNRTLRDALSDAAIAPFRVIESRFKRTVTGGNANAPTIWALRDVSFSVSGGEVLGVIGRNGAGKSTLLKVLSRVTPPTEGFVEIVGRVGALLEVGTGFHPELSGRENVFLNGAILGMKKAEIDRRFDDIVEFAETAEFIDTPIKKYSSGMQLRLAFSVAAHLQPDVLLADEVLAVGDAAFQRKCLGKMDEAARGGRTVIFVSHNMAAVESLCDRVIRLDEGRVTDQGSPREVIDRYLSSVLDVPVSDVGTRADRSGDGSVLLRSVTIEADGATPTITSNSRIRIRIDYESSAALVGAQFLVGVYDHRDQGIFLLDSDAAGGLPAELPPSGTVVCTTEAINLIPGRCYVNLAVNRGGVLADHVDRAARFDVQPTDFFGTGRLPSREWVLTLVSHRWSVP